jgi:arylsulfatase A-like enzyme
MSSTDRPNVLLITVDQWPARLLGCEGHPVVLTPTIDRLAANGVRFSRCYSGCPVCVPARRTLLTGLGAGSHGTKTNAQKPLPDVVTLPQAFRNAGYQAYAVGKMHLMNQRDRAGFDDVLVDEEGRAGEGIGQDDYELWLGDQGYPGQRFAGGMNNNTYCWRPWHLPEHLHVTNWAAWQMARAIRRRDPARPGFWYLSFSHPHPPLAPLRAYLDMYRDKTPPEPVVGDWARDDDRTPVRVRERIYQKVSPRPHEIPDILRAYYAQCTHIDHQIRLVIGTLREAGLVHNTLVMFLADHGDMLGNHNQWAKDQMNEDSNRVPAVLCGRPALERIGHHRVDDRLAQVADVMPTLLDLAGLAIPDHVEGMSLAGEARRDHVFGEWGYGPYATRMVRDERYKLIWFARGNEVLLFDLEADPDELHDLAGAHEYADVRERLLGQLVGDLDAEDTEAWVKDGRLVGLPAGEAPERGPSFGLEGQRGAHWPMPTGEAPWQ